MAALRVFDLELIRSEMVSSSLKRLTFTGARLKEMAIPAPDQRVKLLFPVSDRPCLHIEDSEEAIHSLKQLDEAFKPAMRVYTVRYFRPDIPEIDIEFVIHGANGPASRWAMRAKSGDKLQMIGTGLVSGEKNGGFEWKPPKNIKQVLLMGDETALPAIANILESMALEHFPPQTQVFIEIPLAGDCIKLPKWDGLNVQWLVREQAQANILPGAFLQQAIKQAHIPELRKRDTDCTEFKEIDITKERVWEAGDSSDDAFYVWIAGESAAVLALRNYLIKEAAIPRHMMNLMGYWRYGKKES